jgi:ubiquinone biosynthesis accessory factor UbiK
MDHTHFITDLQKQITQAFAEFTHADKNGVLHSILQQALSQWELVSREEFEIHQNVLIRSREKIDALEKRVQILEANQNIKQSPSTSQTTT